MNPVTDTVVIAKIPINHDCYIFRLQFTGPPIHFAVGNHFRIHATVASSQAPQGEEIFRKYTPITACSKLDGLDFLIKIYRPNQHPLFPEGGKMGIHLQNNVNVGDHLALTGPFGNFTYLQNGNTILSGEAHHFNKIFFIAGGSGITPIFQTILEIFARKEDKTELILLFANKTEDDIVLRKALESFVPRLSLHYILSRAGEEWKGPRGHINEDFLTSICKLDEKETLYAHCGPGAFNGLIRTIFQTKYPESRLFKF